MLIAYLFKKLVQTRMYFAAQQPNHDINQTHDEDDKIRDIPRRYIAGLKKRDNLKRELDCSKLG